MPSRTDASISTPFLEAVPTAGGCLLVIGSLDNGTSALLCLPGWRTEPALPIVSGVEGVLTVTDGQTLAVFGRRGAAVNRVAVSRLLARLFGPHAGRDETTCEAVAVHLEGIPEEARRTVAPLSRQWLALYLASSDNGGRLLGIFRDRRFHGVLKAMLDLVDARDLQEDDLALQLRQCIEHLPDLPREITDIGAYRRQEVCRLARKIEAPDSVVRALAIPVLLGLPRVKLGILRRARRIAEAVLEVIVALPEPLADMRLAKAIAAEPESMRGNLISRLANLPPVAQADLATCRRYDARSAAPAVLHFRERQSTSVKSVGVGGVDLLEVLRPYTQQLATCMGIDGFKAFLRTELETRGPQLILLWLLKSARRRRGQQGRRVPEIAVQQLMTMNRRLLVREITAVPISKAGMKLLFKLDPWIIVKRGTAIVREIADLLVSPIRAKLLAHMRTIEADAWMTVLDLPEWLCIPSVARFPGGSHWSRLRSLAELGDDIGPELRITIRDSLGRARSEKQLLGILDKWKFKVAFPKPPIRPGDACLSPLSSPDLMRQEARVMRNCLANLIPDVVDRRNRYFYRYQGSERATVCLRHTSRSGQAWVVDQFNGPENGPVSRGVKAHIRRIVSGAGSCRPMSRAPPIPPSG